MYNYTGPDKLVSITEYVLGDKYYLKWFIKNEPGIHAKTFPTFEAGMKFALELDKDENLDSRYLVKKIEA